MSKQNERKFYRSGSAVCPVSGVKCPLVLHHIHGRSIKNAEAEWNRCWISPNVHDMVHLGLVVIEGWKMTLEGRKLIWHNKEEDSLTNDDAAPYIYG